VARGCGPNPFRPGGGSRLQLGIQAQASYQGNYDELSESVRAAQEDGGLPDLVTSYLYQAQAWETEESGPQAGQAKGRSQGAGTPGEVLVELDPYVDDPVWGFSPEEQSDFYPAYWEQDVVDGRRLGIPAQRSAQFLYYNLSWAEELGFDEPPATPEQFRRQACTAAEANQQDDDPDNDLTGGWIISTHYATVSAWIHAFGGEIARANASGSGGSYQFDTPEAEESLRFLRDLHDQGCAWLAEGENGDRVRQPPGPVRHRERGEHPPGRLSGGRRTTMSGPFCPSPVPEKASYLRLWSSFVILKSQPNDSLLPGCS
jgi:ABC-type glycerol-3-phosphate transport system substrate-binding protein